MKAKTGKNRQTQNDPNIHCAKVNQRTLELDTSHGYKLVRIIGTGTFGAVFEATDVNGRHVAIKKVIQDHRYKNRELDILQKLYHPNCLFLEQYYFTKEGPQQETYLHLVSMVFPLDLSSFLKKYSPMPISMVKIFAYQMFCAIAYIHSLNICHRDIKTRNVLVDPASGLLQICDFGSAKPIVPNETSVSYIATRSYRAPELLFGCTTYGTSVDVWACGCVLAEMLIGQHPLFNGQNNDQMVVSIANVIGSPTRQEMHEMGAQIPYKGMPQQRNSLTHFFPNVHDPLLISLLEQIFVYSPARRLTARGCVTHPYFQDLKAGKVILPNGQPFIPRANEDTQYGKVRNM